MKQLSILILLSTGISQAATVASYDSGVSPTAGTTGAADPTSQGWTSSGATGNNYAYGGDSTIGGWRVVDGTNSAAFFYQVGISGTDLADMNTNGWVATATVALSEDAVSAAGGGVNGYYAGGNQNNNALWIESASGTDDYLYTLIFNSNANGDLIINDSVASYTVATSSQLSSELSGTSANYMTLTLTYTPGSGASLSTDLGGSIGAINTSSIQSPATDRVIWGSFSSAGQGGTVWNQVSLDTVPEPSVSLLGLLALAGCLRRRR